MLPVSLSGTFPVVSKDTAAVWYRWGITKPCGSPGEEKVEHRESPKGRARRGSPARCVTTSEEDLNRAVSKGDPFGCEDFSRSKHTRFGVAVNVFGNPAVKVERKNVQGFSVGSFFLPAWKFKTCKTYM